MPRRAAVRVSPLAGRSVSRLPSQCEWAIQPGCYESSPLGWPPAGRFAANHPFPHPVQSATLALTQSIVTARPEKSFTSARPALPPAPRRAYVWWRRSAQAAEGDPVFRKLTAPAQPLRGIDRMIRNVETGRFERSLSGLTAAGAVVTAAEIYFEHDKASFGDPWMWAPVVLGPVGAVAGVAGVFSHRAAKTLLPLAAATIVANGLQGVYLHARGIGQKPGRLAQPPLQPGDGTAAPRTAAGHAGRRDGPARRDPEAREMTALPLSPADGGGRFPGFDVLSQQGHWDDVTRGMIEDRLAVSSEYRFFTPRGGGGRHARCSTSCSTSAANRPSRSPAWWMRASPPDRPTAGTTTRCRPTTRRGGGRWPHSTRMRWPSRETRSTCSRGTSRPGCWPASRT